MMIDELKQKMEALLEEAYELGREEMRGEALTALARGPARAPAPRPAMRKAMPEMPVQYQQDATALVPDGEQPDCRSGAAYAAKFNKALDGPAASG